MPRDLDPSMPEMRAQMGMLRGIKRAGLKVSWCGFVLAERLGGTPATWRTRLARAIAGKGSISMGALLVLLDEVTIEERRTIYDAALEDSGLRVEVEVWDPDPYTDEELVDDIDRAGIEATEVRLEVREGGDVSGRVRGLAETYGRISRRVRSPRKRAA